MVTHATNKTSRWRFFPLPFSSSPLINVVHELVNDQGVFWCKKAISLNTSLFWFKSSQDKIVHWQQENAGLLLTIDHYEKNNNNISPIHAKLYFAVHVVQTVFINVSNNVLFIYYHVSWEFQYAGKSREHGLMRAYLLQ